MASWCSELRDLTKAKRGLPLPVLLALLGQTAISAGTHLAARRATQDVDAVSLVTMRILLSAAGYVGVLLALHIVVTGLTLVRESMLGLMDTGLPPAQLDIIRATLVKYAEEGVQYHALRTRRAAARQFMSVHLLMPGDWTISRGHDLAERMEADLRKAVPGLVVLTHLEPDDDPVSWHDVELERREPAE